MIMTYFDKFNGFMLECQLVCMSFGGIRMRPGSRRWVAGIFFILTISFYSSNLAAEHTEDSMVSLYESIFQQHGAIMMLIEPQSGDIIFANNAAATFYGYPVETLQNMNISAINVLSEEEIEHELQQAEQDHRNYFIFRHRLADEQIRDVEVYSYPVMASDRTLLFSVIIDITDKLAAEAQLERDQNRRQVGVLAVSIFFFIGLIILAIVNRQRRAAIQTLKRNYQVQQLIADISLDFARSAPEQMDVIFTNALNRCSPLLKIDRSAICLISDDHRYRVKTLSWSLMGYEWPDSGKIMNLNGIPWILEQVQQQKSVYINDVAEMPPEAAHEKALFQVQGVRAKCIMPIVISGKTVAVWGMDSLTGPLDWARENDNLRHVLSGIFSAALDRKLSFDQLVFWQNLLGSIVEHDPSSIAVLDKNMNYMFTSKRFLTDYRVKQDNLVGLNHYDVFPEISDHWRKIHERVLSGAVERSEEEKFVRNDGSVDYTRYQLRPWYQQDGQVGGIVMYLEVITERKKQEEKRIAELSQYRQQQKLESIGTLASGVAHEINNPIMGIINYAQLVKDDSENPAIKAFAEEIIIESKRISSITSDLLFYSRQQKQAHSPADIHDIIQRTLSLIKSSLQKDQIEVSLKAADDLPMLKCRSQQIQQILMNLLTNARDALNEKYSRGDPDKTIELATALFEEGGRRWIRVSVEDHGNGISQDIQDKLFDPFFTTKPREIGTGLGLPISFGIARDHHGRLSFETEVGRFTRFNLELPVDNGWDIEET